jgi:uncharacterized damage-inducible protein DinB
MRGLSFGELLDYCAEETNHWRDWFRNNPAALELPSDIAGTKTVREVVLHIVAVQMRYAERLLNLPITEYDTLSSKTSDELFALAHKSAEDLRSFAVAANDPDWDGVLTFPTRTGARLVAAGAKSSFTRCFTGCGIGRSLQPISGSKVTSRIGNTTLSSRQ